MAERLPPELGDSLLGWPIMVLGAEMTTGTDGEGEKWCERLCAKRLGVVHVHYKVLLASGAFLFVLLQVACAMFANSASAAVSCSCTGCALIL